MLRTWIPAAMSARSRWHHTLLCFVFGASTAFAAELQEPDMEFLEYLGLWEESDEEWLMMEHQINLESEERIDPVPEGEESTEDDDES
jgi:hypothetical protein